MDLSSPSSPGMWDSDVFLRDLKSIYYHFESRESPPMSRFDGKTTQNDPNNNPFFERERITKDTMANGVSKGESY